MTEKIGALEGDGIPNTKVDVRETFGLDVDLEVPAFSEPSDHVPPVDENYLFNHETTLAILAGYAYNRRCMIQGYHGTGKSTHVEQIAARLNWPCIRINLDSHVSRIDLVGKDAIVLKDGKQVTEFREGFLPWALQRACSIVFDDFDQCNDVDDVVALRSALYIDVSTEVAPLKLSLVVGTPTKVTSWRQDNWNSISTTSVFSSVRNFHRNKEQPYQ